MSALTQPPVEAAPHARQQDGERRFLMRGISWPLYLMLRDSLDDSGVRMTYREGELELMSPGHNHELWKKTIARLIETWAMVEGVPLTGLGSKTHRREDAERGLEPDECYFVGEVGDTPDLALEVVVTQPLIDKLDVYRGLGVREVWVFGGESFSIQHLDDDGVYQEIARSRVLPGLALDAVAELVRTRPQHEAVQAWFQRLQSERSSRAG